MRRVLIIALLAAAAATGAEDAYQRAKRKIDLIEQDKTAPGSSVWLSLAELNAYVRGEARKVVPQGVRNGVLALGNGTATGSALVDFLKVRELKGGAPNLILAWLLTGEKPVRVTARIQSGQGRATVFVEEVDVSGVKARGAVLDFLIANFLLPIFPDAKIGRPFQLEHGVERFEISPRGVNVRIAAKPAGR
jgi:hypothetical protein